MPVQDSVLGAICVKNGFLAKERRQVKLLHDLEITSMPKEPDRVVGMEAHGG